MATPNIVPRSDSEGGLGTSSKYWASAYIDAVNAATYNGIPFYSGDTGSIYTHDVSATDSTATYNTAYGLTAMDAITTADNNTAVGYAAGSAINSGSNNTLFGSSAGKAITTGTDNVAIGYATLETEDTGAKNIAIGKSALNVLNFDGDGYNVAVGYDAGKAMTTGVKNTILGANAGMAMTDSYYNVAVGFESLKTSTGYGYNTAVGYRALQVLNVAANGHNVAVGYNSGVSMTTGTNNTVIGSLAGDALTTGYYNTAVGKSALSSSASGRYATAVGFQALLNENSADTETYNVAVGYNAGLAVSTGVQNTIIGGLAGSATDTGGTNTFIGYSAGATNEGGGDNIAIGKGADFGGASFSNAIVIGTDIVQNLGSNVTEIGNSSMTKFKTHGAMVNRAYTGIAEGSGIDATDAVSISVGEYNSEIITNIFVDIGVGSIQSSSTDTGALGNATDANAYITQVTTAVNGIVYKAELICLEVPTVSSGALMLDIDLSTNASGTIASGSAVTAGTPICESAGSATLGRLVKSTVAITPDDYLYLAQSGTNSGVYNAGKFLIRLYGAKVTGL